MPEIPFQTTPSRRSFLAGLGAAGLSACSSPTPAPFEEYRPPNILFAVADDQSWPHAGAYGDRIIKTPAFDRVAAEGALFTHSFAACPSCTPSRSSILTGRSIWQIGEAGVLYGALPPEHSLFTHTLEDVGYHVGFTGKGWGPGDWQAAGLKRPPIGREFNDLKVEGGVPAGIDERDYAANFEAFLGERPADAPFFFWFGCTEPHRVYGDGLGRESGMDPAEVEVPPYWPDTATIRNDILDYYFEIQWFDQHLGRMLAKLEQMGELDRTLVVVTSDNGMPFPRAKVNLYDPGVRMPLAMRWPERVPGGRRIDDIVSHIDLAPTFLEAAGQGIPDEVAGRSLVPLLEREDSGILDHVRDATFPALERHTWCRPDGAAYPIRAIRTREYLYLRNFEPDRWPTGGPDFISSNKTPHGDVDGCPTKDFMLAAPNRAKFPRQYELCYGKRPLEELYDIAADPHQINNVAGDPKFQEIKEALWKRLESHLRRTGDPRLAGQDPWQDYVYRQTVGFGASFNRSLSEDERDKAAGRGAHKPE